MVLENAKGKLRNSTVVIDESGSDGFQRRLSSYLKRKNINREDRLIKKVKMQRSQSNNLLQLADYVAGVINRSVSDNKKDAEGFRRLIAHREMQVQIWPK
jgi:hypothetical protein